MAATVWSPAPYISKQEWLLEDGSIVISPDFETTSSGRRVRVAGSKESIGSRQVDTLIQASIDKIATERGTTRLLRIFPEPDTDVAASNAVGAPDTVFTDAVTLHLLNAQQAQRDRGRTVAVWKYRDVNHAPVVAYVFVTLEQRYNDTYQVHTHVVWRDTRPTYASHNSLLVADGSYIQGQDMYRYGEPHQQVQERLVNGGLLPFTLGSKNFHSQMRTAVVKFAEQARLVDQFDEISIPDTADPQNVRVFKRVASNYSASFNAELLDFVQTGPVLERIKENYDQLLQDFKTLGIVVTERIDGGDLAQAVHGDLTKIQATVRATDDEEETGNALDPHHTVAFDFATGTVVVNCGHSNDLDETAQAWEIAKFKAEMTGEVDVLLEYARAYRDPKEQARLRKIIKGRKVDIDNPDSTNS